MTSDRMKENANICSLIQYSVELAQSTHVILEHF